MRGDRIDTWFDELWARLGGLPPAAIEEIVAELRSHVHESLREGGEPEAVLARLGTPEEIAALYRADRSLARAGGGRSPWLLVTGVTHWATVSLAGFFALLGLVAGLWVAASFGIAAVTKLFAPGRVGLWRLPGGEYSLRLGLLPGSMPEGQELLGFWIIPIGFAAGAIVWWVTSRLVRSAGARWRRSPVMAAERRIGRVTTSLRAAVRTPAFAVVEIAAVVALFIADARHLVPLSNTPFLLLLGWASLRLRGLRWRDIGLTRPDDWRRVVVIGVVAGLAMETFAVLVTEPCIARLFGHAPDVSDFKFLVGNLKALLLLQILNWTLAAFGEEMVYRGYLLNRVADFAGPLGSRAAFATALVLVSLLFGWAHAEGQGLPGMAQEGWNGLLLGVLYLANRRRLAVPIIAHGVSNTLAFVLIYLGKYPGVS